MRRFRRILGYVLILGGIACAVNGAWMYQRSGGNSATALSKTVGDEFHAFFGGFMENLDMDRAYRSQRVLIANLVTGGILLLGGGVLVRLNREP